MSIDIHAHMKNITLSHMVFALPFAYAAAFLAAGGVPSAHDLVWITVAIAGARSAAMALDNLVDLKYDRDQPRFKNRPIVAGRISPQAVKISILLYIAVFLLAVCQLQPICRYLAPVAALPFIIYPYMKRITPFCHGVLGIAISMAPAGGYMAVAGEGSWALLVLCLAVALWIAAFDGVYCLQDEAFDRAHKLHSMATALGVRGALNLTRILHVLSILCFFALGNMLNLTSPYFLGVGLAAGTLIYQHSIVSPHDLSRVTQSYFMRNGVVSISMFICIWISLYVK